MIPGIGEAFTASWRKMKAALFAPFNLSAWFVLTLGAWLAGLGESGFNFNFPIKNLPSGKDEINILLQPLQTVADRFGTSIAILVISVGTIFFILGLTIGLILLWVRCRSRFVFLDMLINGAHANTFSNRWNFFDRQGNSFFFAQIILTAVMIFLGICSVGGLILAAVFFAVEASGVSVLLFVFFILLFIIVTACIAIYLTIFNDYGAILMYRTGCSGTEALNALNRKIMERPGIFFIYMVGLFLYTVIISVLLILFSCLTCCIGSILFMIPFISTMVLLPVIYIRWQYSIEFFDNPEMLR